MGLDVNWYSNKAKEAAIAEARKMNEALEKRIVELERIVRHLSDKEADACSVSRPEGNSHG